MVVVASVVVSAVVDSVVDSVVFSVVFSVVVGSVVVTVVGSVVQNPKNPALWGIRNEDKVIWTYEKPDGTQIPVEPGKTAGIAAGVKIHFPNSVGEFR